MGSKLPALFLATGLASLNAVAQSAAAPPPRFQVASVKRCPNTEPVSGAPQSPGRLTVACVTTANLIRLAYLVFPTGQPNSPVSPSAFQQPISGGPSWIDSDRYRIDAKIAGPVNVEMMRGPMMQALLEDRFQLKLHRETREIAVFALEVAKGGPKLQPAKAGACVAFDRNQPKPEPASAQPSQPICGTIRTNANGGIDIPGVTMAVLCRQLSAYVEHDIADRTGIEGTFEVHLDLSPADLGEPGAAPDPSSPFTVGDGGAVAASVRKLGLQMRAAKGKAEFLVIDRIERPTEN